MPKQISAGRKRNGNTGPQRQQLNIKKRGMAFMYLSSSSADTVLTSFWKKRERERGDMLYCTQHLQIKIIISSHFDQRVNDFIACQVFTVNLVIMKTGPSARDFTCSEPSEAPFSCIHTVHIKASRAGLADPATTRPMFWLRWCRQSFACRQDTCTSSPQICAHTNFVVWA